VSIAVTFCAQTKRECCDNESGDSFFRWSEAESLPHFIEREAPDLFQLAKVFKVNSEIDPCAAAEPEPSAGNAGMKGLRQSMERDSRYDVSRKFSRPQRRRRYLWAVNALIFFANLSRLIAAGPGA
jgi:hypothetical protein